MIALGVLLVHGYTGHPNDMLPVQQRLSDKADRIAVQRPCLPGHLTDAAPAFDSDRFATCIDHAVDILLGHCRRLVLIGHSTGGTLLLDHVIRRGTLPDLLVLAGTPSMIRGEDLKRWEHHREHAADLPLSQVARLVSHVNRIGRMTIEKAFPVLILQGEADTLVPPTHAEAWRHRFPGPVRHIQVPNGGHSVFKGPGSAVALDILGRAVADIAAGPGSDPGDPSQTRIMADVNTLATMDPEVSAHIDARPTGPFHHLVHAPAARQALGQAIPLAPEVPGDPIQLNVEITSRCNLNCGHCARTRIPRSPRDMSPQAFDYLLHLLPNTFKLVLVGLGEPTLHPELATLVRMAADKGIRVTMVTNAMMLDAALSRQLLDAGLSGLTISLDSVDPAIADTVRPGSDVARIIANASAFVRLSRGRVPTAVFSAVSAATVKGLPELAQAVAQLGVRAWMLSDLNFPWNRSATLWQAWAPDYRESIGSALRLAFSHGLPVLSVRALEAMGIARRLTDFLVRSPAGLAERSSTHHTCQSPWQTLPVDVNGNASVCDCQPDHVAGNLFHQAMGTIWNGPRLQALRRRMLTAHPPAACTGCPRF